MMRNKYTIAKPWLLLTLGLLVILTVPVKAACPDPDFVCDYYPPLLGYDAVLTGFCGGPDCFDKSYGAEATVKATDDVLFTDSWKVRHSGEITNISCAAVEEKLTKTFVWMPAGEPSCAISLQTENHLYFHFFASNPATLCLGWVECKVY